MAEVNPPMWLKNLSTNDVDALRRAIGDAMGGNGVATPGGLAVTQNGSPNMSVNVAAGRAYVPGTENATAQGMYGVYNDAVTNRTIAASDPTNPRNDLVVAKVQDTQYSGGTNAWAIAVVTGTPAGSPVDPAVPVNAIILARVRVTALASSIDNAHIDDLRPFIWTDPNPVGTTGANIGLSNPGKGRFLGTWTTVGPPSATFPSGAAIAGDHGFDSNGAFWVCTAGGGSGTWQTPPVGGHLNTKGTAPSLGALQAGISTQTMVAGSTDNAMTITLVCTGAAPAAGAIIAVVGFANAFGGVPVIVCSVQGGNMLYVATGNDATTGFDIRAGVNMVNAATYTIKVLVLGHS